MFHELNILCKLYFSDIIFLCRTEVFKQMLELFKKVEGGIENVSLGYKYFGVHVQPDNGIEWLEWAPGARGVYLRGEFSK